MLDMMTGDDYIDYALTLKSDINQLLLSFLNILTESYDYISIREDLIYYKYQLLFVDILLEDNFIMDSFSSKILLKTNNYRTNDMPASYIIDLALLVLEGNNYIQKVIELPDNFQFSPNLYSSAVIDIINVLARLVMCDEHTLYLLENDFNGLLEENIVLDDVKVLIQEMINILQKLNPGIDWAR